MQAEMRVIGPHLDGASICSMPARIYSTGLWLGDNPLGFSIPLLSLQVVLMVTATRVTRYLLKPLNQPTIVSDILSGIILGPSVLGRSKTYTRLVFPLRGVVVLETAGMFGLMLYLFIVGVKMDPSMIKKTGKRVWGIAFLSTVVPMLSSQLAIALFKPRLTKDAMVHSMLGSLTWLLSLSTFPVIASFLTDLNILNSELGRLALSCSMICDTIAWIFAASITIAKKSFMSARNVYWAFTASVILVVWVIISVRPYSLYINRRTPVGQPVKEQYIFTILVAVLISAFCSEVIGQKALLGPFLVGLVIPDGPPLGEALVERLDMVITGMLMPLYFAASGLKTNLSVIQDLTVVGTLELVVVCTSLGKILGSILIPCLCSRVPFREALAFGLIMNSQGLIELVVLNAWRDTKVSDEESFSILVISTLIVTAISGFLVGILYKPSMHYVAYKRRTIQHVKGDAELRILSCVFREEDVPPIIDILEASHPTKRSPINIFVLHLIHLVGRATPLLFANKSTKPSSSSSSNPSSSDRITNVFKHFQNQPHHQDIVSVHSFTAVSPHGSMHDDICSIALQKRVSLVVLPFYKPQPVIASADVSNRFVNDINRNVLNLAPCSVGVLIDHRVSKASAKSNRMVHRVAVLFVGGQDDREALSFATRMTYNPAVTLKVLRFVSPKEDEEEKRGRKLDDEVVSLFRSRTNCNEHVSYQQEIVSRGEETIKVIRRMRNSYDLFLVGRSMNIESRATSGLKEGSVSQELGIIGDYLASPSFKATTSVLVVQQQQGKVKEAVRGSHKKLMEKQKRALKKLREEQEERLLHAKDVEFYLS